MDDWQLLKDYADNRSEEAFRTLVERYSGMVYHAALRQTGNAHLAEEAAQSVFIALAQKAGRIPRQATLYGWLFRATRFAVLNQVRSEINRERREFTAHVMQTTSEPNEADSTWELLTPQLNDALENLSESDRELVMIRFFGNKSHQEVAEALGLSEETARKRMSRAMERLREIFAKRGVAVSSVALAAALAAHGAKAAPMNITSSWAETAMAKAGAAAASDGGTLSWFAAAKAPAFIASLAGVLVVGGLTFAFLKAKTTARGLPIVATTNSVAPVTNSASIQPVAVAPSTPRADTNAYASALDKVKAALHDPVHTYNYPNPAMQSAIAGLGDKKKLSVPLLEAALNDTNAEVCLRAVDGLGMVGPPAGEAAPALMALLRDGGFGDSIPDTKYSSGQMPNASIYSDNMVFYALAQIHPSPDIIGQLAAFLKQDRYGRNMIYQAMRQFNSSRRTMVAGGWLYDIADQDAKLLNNAFRPLLTDPDRIVREVAAPALAKALGDQADSGIYPVAVEMLRSGDDIFLRHDAISLLHESARDLTQENPPVDPVLTAPRLGPYLNSIVSALADTAYHTKQERLRLAASKILDELVPGFREHNPALASELEYDKQSEDFVLKVMAANASRPEILAGLKKFPGAAPRIASFYARTGSNVVDLFPAFTEALVALAPAPDASKGDRQVAVNERGRLVEAMQEIAPDLPKPIFAVKDTVALSEITRDPVIQSDPARAQKVAEALKLAEWPDGRVKGLFDVPPDEVRRLLAAMKPADPQTYDALAAKVKEIDPHFTETTADSGKEN